MNDLNDEPPSICESCLTKETKHIRMVKKPVGAQCKICTIPFSVYQFNLPDKKNLIKTIICKNCSKQRNCCQCCLLDLTWNIPIQLRDQILEMIDNGFSSQKTDEAKNEMMKLFLSMKNGNKVKFNGAKITSDLNMINQAMESFQKIINGQLSVINLSNTSTKADKKCETENFLNEKYKDIDIKPILKKLPINNSINAESRSFFIYGIDPIISEWELIHEVTSLVGYDDWQDKTTVSVLINHNAKCGGIRFKNDNLSKIFVDKLKRIKTRKTVKGILQVKHIELHVVSWPGFNLGVFGDKYSHHVKLGLSLDKLVQKDLGYNLQITNTSKVNKIKKKNTKKN